jgi:hypothetical protein
MRYAATAPNRADYLSGVALEPSKVFEIAATKSEQLMHNTAFCTKQHRVGVKLIPIVLTQDVIPVIVKAYGTTH